MADIFKPAPEPPTELGRYRILSSSAGVRVSPLQLGAMSIGQSWEKTMGSMDKEQSFKLLDAFYEAGGNFIDTANNYQDEQSETWLGEWMASRKNREDIVLATKFTSQYRAWQTGKGTRVNNSGNHRHSLHVSVRDSLRKLQTDWIDLLYVHWWDHTTSIKELMDGLHILVQQGKVLYLGVSDTPAWIVSAANEYALAYGKTPFSVYQGRWSVMVRDVERDILPMARQYGMAIAPWDVIGGGKFQTKAAIEERKKKGEGLRALFAGGEQNETEEKISGALEKVANEHGVGLQAIALAYVMAKAPNVFPIIGGRKVEHLKSNIEALKVKLTPGQIEYLESQVPFDLGFPMNVLGSDPKLTGKATGILAGTGNFSFVQAPKAIGY